MRTVLVFGVTFVAGALFFACAKGDAAATAGDGSGDTTEDGGAGDGARDGNSSYVTDSGESGDSAADGGVDAAPVCIESDAGCLTGSPGACSDGILHCDGGVAVCEAVTTTESCYSADAATRNTGICHDGTQTCTGTLGACTGEVDPAAHEDCFNTLDDDCNGLVNDGCPAAITLGATTTLPGAGGGGGGPKTVLCPTGAFVTRVDSWFDNSDQKASGVSIFCATPTLVQGASSYSVTLAANTPAPYLIEHGTTSASDQRTDDCGISGLSAITYELGYADSWVEALGHHCSSGALTLNADNTISFTFTQSAYGNPPGEFNSYSTPPPGSFFIRDCDSSATNQVVVGYAIHDGAYLDNITPICAPLVVTASAGTPDP